MKRAVNIAAAVFNLIVVATFVAVGLFLVPGPDSASADTGGATSENVADEIFVPMTDQQLMALIMSFDTEVPYTDQELRCLTQNLYFEARSEGTAGMLAVGFVTLNRVSSERFPDTICNVIYQGQRDGSGNMIRHRCQFSWYCDGRSDRMRNPEAEAEARRIAALLLNDFYRENKYLVDITEGSLFYHTNSVNPSWRNDRGMSPVTQIGTHIFYSWNT